MADTTPDTAALDTIAIGDFLESVGAKSPAPGGGAVAAVVMGLSAALGRMVVNYSVGRKALAEYATDHERALTTLASLSQSAAAAADADQQAYTRLNALWKLPEDDPDRLAGWDSAVKAAIAAPRGVLDQAVHILMTLVTLEGKTNRFLASDLAMAAILAEAAARSAAWNVRINLALLDDDENRAALTTGLATTLATAADLARGIESRLLQG